MALTILVGFPAPVPAARPGYDAVLQFGRQLQQDYAEHRSKAIVDRLADADMRRRVFEVFGAAGLESEEAHKAWDDSFRPIVVGELAALDQFTMLLASRVMLLEGRRVLECILLDPENRYQVLMLWLNQGSDGGILINDCKTLGSSLEITRRLRHVALLLGAPFSVNLDEEEKDITFHIEAYGPQIKQALSLMGQQKMSEAFTVWMRLSPELKAKRIWRDIRAGMAARGGKEAQKQIRDEYRRGQLADRFLCYTYAQEEKDLPGAIAAMELVLAENHQTPFLRMQKGELLLQAGQPMDALALARDVYQLNPLLIGGYALGVRAAVAGGRPADALQALQAWSLVMSGSEMKKILATDPALEGFLRSADYVLWQKQAEAEAALNSTTHP